MRSLRFANATVEMTYKEKASFNSQTLKVNNFQILFKHAIENKIFHVIALCIENPPTRHFDRNEAKLSEVEKSQLLLSYKQ